MSDFDQDIVDALRAVTGLADRINDLADHLPPEEGWRLRRSSSASAINLAMAIDAARRDLERGGRDQS